MRITKLSRGELNDMVNNVDQEDAVNVVKFYSDSCPMCANLRDYYVDISYKFSKVNFFVFNMNRGEGVEKKLNFRGTPTLAMIKTGDNPKILIMPDPDNPNDRTWYYSKDIIKFIKDNYKDEKHPNLR